MKSTRHFSPRPLLTNHFVRALAVAWTILRPRRMEVDEELSRALTLASGP